MYAATVLVTAVADPHFFLYDCTILLVPALLLLAVPTGRAFPRVGFAAIYVALAFAPALHEATKRMPGAFAILDTQWSVLVMAGLLAWIWYRPGRGPVVARRVVPNNARQPALGSRF